MTEDDDGPTEWKTVKIPKRVRDTARDREPTYGELLTFGIEAYDADLVGSNDAGDVWVNVPDGDGEDAPVDMDSLAERIADVVDREGGAGPEAIAREVARELDYVELADSVADELEARSG